MWQFVKDFFIYGFTSIFGKLIAVFLMPLYTSILTKEEYGTMALITACQGILGLFSNLNIHSGIARDYFEENINRKSLVSTGIWSILGFSSLILIFMLITREFWLVQILEIEQSYMVPFIVMLFSIPAGSSLSYFAIITRYKRKPINYSIGTLIQLIVQVSISILFVVVMRTGIVGVFLGILFGELVGTIYYMCINRSEIGCILKLSYLKRALLFSLPTLPAILAGWIDSSMGQVIIGKYISKADLGVYSIALQLTSVFSFMNIALHNVWGPYLYENYKKEGFIKEVKKIYTIFVVILTVVAVSVSLMSREIILLLSNSTYLDATKYFTLLCIPMCIYLLFPIATSGISISRDTKYIGISHVIGSIINLIFMFIMIKYIGILSVPIALALSRITTYSILYYVSKKKGLIVLPNGVLLIMILSIITCFYIVNMQIDVIYRILIVLAICIYATIYSAKNANLKSLFKLRRRKISN